MESMSAQELSRLDIKGIKISQPYGRLLGEPEQNAVIFIWGEKGAGKSTMSLGLADALAQHGRIEYIPAEEHFGKTLVDRVKRLDATHPNLNFTKWKSISALKEMLLISGAFACVLDSISVIDANAKETVELAQWCREHGIMFVMVAHATKDGKYKGNTSVAHECDIEIKVTKEGGAETEKNRYRELTTIDVPFTAKDREIVRENSGGNNISKLTDEQFRHVNDILSNNEVSTDEELIEYFREEIGLTQAQAQHWIKERSNYLMNPRYQASRKNPVDTPFKITLKEIDRLHRIRSWKRINSMLGSKMPCYAPKHSGESENAHLSVRYIADYRKKRYLLELLLDGHLEYQACTEGKGGSVLACWKKLVKEYGDLEIRIYKQDHAKVVLGTKEYKRQEREYAKKQQKPTVKKETRPAAKKSAPTGKTNTTAAAKVQDAEKHHSKDIPIGRKNIVFRVLHTLSSNKPLGITWAKHDGTPEGIVKAAQKATQYADYVYGNDYTNMGSPIFATDETGKVAHAVSPNYKTLAGISTKQAFNMYGLFLKNFGVDVSVWADKPGTSGRGQKENEKFYTPTSNADSPATPKEAAFIEQQKKQRTKKKKEGTAKGNRKKKTAEKSRRKTGAKKTEVDIEAAKKSQKKLDAFLEKILN